MRPIPSKLKKQINFKQSILGGKFEELHHAFKYAGKQINELWAFAPLTVEQHRGINGVHKNKDLDNKVKFILLDNAKKQGLFNEIKLKYPKNDWEQEYNYLKIKYGFSNSNNIRSSFNNIRDDTI